MESSTTIKGMLAGNKIFVPSYQRAYSWETTFNKEDLPKHTNVFITDLEDFNKSGTQSKYYFGHFLFEENEDNVFGVVDGQQRLTTIVLFISALFKRLKEIRPLIESEQIIFEDIIRRNSIYKFDTVEYDRQLFRDYVINQIKKDRNGLETVSAKRIVDAFDFFTGYLAEKDEYYVLKMLDTVQKASCTTHPVKDPSEAIQMFIFQNNRGKKPSNLEIIKAQFMYSIHLHGAEQKDILIEEVKSRFDKIYRSISLIEYRINEDDILLYTLRVYFNSLWETNAIDKIDKLLSEPNPVQFIKSFTYALSVSFDHLTTFLNKHERENQDVHSLVTLGEIGIVLPFIIKAYSFGLDINEIGDLCRGFESLVLRHRLIGTRAEITSRINEEFKKFSIENPDVKSIIRHINWMKTVHPQNWWWSYWNNTELERSIQGKIHHSTAKYLLWKYENYLGGLGNSGYRATRYDKIVKPELEHIAPKTENPEAGYDKYDDEFKTQYIDCLGNYLLISKSHNCSVGNKPFAEKRASYRSLEQQLQIQQLTVEDFTWTKELILQRKNEIIKFVIENI